jgi:predicted kinase
MKRLILLVGLPASGKSVRAAELVEQGFISCSQDTIRQNLYGDPSIQGDPKLVADLFDQRYEALLSAGADIVIDNTNIWPALRKPLLDRAGAHGYRDVSIWVVDTPLVVCLWRNFKRSRRVSVRIILELYWELRRTRASMSSEAPCVKFLTKRSVP